MEKALLIGKFNVVFKDLYDFLDEKDNLIHIQVCPDEHIDSIKSILKMVKPRLVIISLIGLDKDFLKLFADIRHNHDTSRVLCIGTESEQKLFEAFLETEQFSVITRPCTNRKIWTKVKAMLDIKEKNIMKFDDDWFDDAPVKQEGEPQPTSSIDVVEEREPQPVQPTKAVEESEPQPVQPTEVVEEIKRIRVLLVDDNAIQLRALRSVMMKDYEILMATSGEDAIEIMREERPDIVFLDYEMPGLNGKQVLEIVRNSDDLKDIPVVFLAGVQDRQVIIELVGLKPNGYLVKPPNIEMINEVIHKFVG